jgi:hypothetical protein
LQRRGPVLSWRERLNASQKFCPAQGRIVTHQRPFAYSDADLFEAIEDGILRCLASGAFPQAIGEVSEYLNYFDFAAKSFRLLAIVRSLSSFFQGTAVLQPSAKNDVAFLARIRFGSLDCPRSERAARLLVGPSASRFSHDSWRGGGTWYDIDVSSRCRELLWLSDERPHQMRKHGK